MHQFETFIINTRDLFDKLVWFETQITSDILVLDLESNSEIEKIAKVYGIGLCFTDQKAFYIPWRSKDGKNIWSDADANHILSWLRCITNKRKVIGHNIIYDVLVLENNFGIVLDNYIHADTILMKHTLEEEPPFALKEIAEYTLGSWAVKAQEALKQNVIDSGGKWTEDQKDMYLADTSILGEYCCWDVMITLLLYNLFNERLEKEGLTKFFYEDEVMPLYKEVTINMKRKGFRIDKEHFLGLKKDLTSEIQRLQDEILTDIKHHIEKFESDLLDKKFPWNNAGNFPKFYADVAGIPLPINKKTGKLTLAAKAVQQQKEANPDPAAEALYDYILDIQPRMPLDPIIALETQKRMFFNANPEKRYIFNLSSGDHIGYLLFTALGIKPFKFTEGGKPSTDKEVLDELIEQYKTQEPWMEKLFDFRKLGKLLSTYVEGILEREIDGVIYASMLQFGTLSGRYSSTNPNLQNLPGLKDDDSGLSELVKKYVNAIRKGFISGKGRRLVADDFEQLEPSCFAHVSGDKKLQEVFHKGEDLYSSIAINANNLEGYSADKKAATYLGKLQKQIRKDFKAIALGIPYGAENSRVSQLMGISYNEAGDVIENYMRAYPDLKRWMTRSNYLAKTTGIISTELGRIRHLPKVKSIYTLYGDNVLDYKWAKKNNQTDIRREYKNQLNNAKNFQIQGLAAHIVNRSAIAIAREFKRLNLDANIILQIHDELVVECAEEITAIVCDIMQRCMENTVKLSVPLRAKPVVADNLADAK